MSRDTLINIGCTAFTFGYIALVLLIGIFAHRHDLRQAQQEQGGAEPVVEFSEEQLAALYELKRRYVAQEVQP